MSKLPSGNYRKRIYLGRDSEGKRMYKSITASTKSELKKKEAEFRLSSEATEAQIITFVEALDNLLASKSNVLSPTTIEGYRSIRRQGTDLDNMNVFDITQNDIQKFINKYAENHKPHTVYNCHGVIVSTIHSVRPDMPIHTALPQKQVYEITIPEDKDVKLLISNAEGDLLKGILLAAFGPMRRGEVCGATYEDIKKDTIHVHQSMCLSDHKWVLKAPKTTASDRYITYPHKVIKMLGKGTGPIVKMDPGMLYRRYHKLCSKLGIDFRFHDLRHYSASILHALGVPDAYIQQRGGWKTDTTLKNVYRHTMQQEQKKNNDLANEHFSSLL